MVYVNQYFEKNLSTSEVTTHYFLGGKQVAYKRGNELRYPLDDHLFSSVGSMDSSGNKVATVKYFPFGGTRLQEGDLGFDKMFTGQRLDQTGLYYYGARYYDANIGRFISPDTIVPNPANPQTLNRYSYCLNNPLKYVDPSGHGPEVAVVVVVVGVGILVFGTYSFTTTYQSTGSFGEACSVAWEGMKSGWNSFCSLFPGSSAIEPEGPGPADAYYTELATQGILLLTASRTPPSISTDLMGAGADLQLATAGESGEWTYTRLGGELAGNAGGAGTPQGPFNSKRDELLSQVTNPGLRKAINELYRPGATVGDGGTAAYIRETGDVGHITKGMERYVQLERILQEEKLSEVDFRIAQNLYQDLGDALQQYGVALP